MCVCYKPGQCPWRYAGDAVCLKRLKPAQEPSNAPRIGAIRRASLSLTSSLNFEEVLNSILKDTFSLFQDANHYSRFYLQK